MVHLSELLSSLSPQVERALTALVRTHGRRKRRHECESVHLAVGRGSAQPENIVTEIRRPNHVLRPELVTEVVARYEAGDPVVAIAKQFGIHRVTVNMVVDRAGVPLRVESPRMDDALQARACDLYEQGLSLAKVSAKIGVPATTVKRALLANGVRLRGRSERVDGGDRP